MGGPSSKGRMCVRNCERVDNCLKQCSKKEMAGWQDSLPDSSKLEEGGESISVSVETFEHLVNRAVRGRLLFWPHSP